MQLTLLVKTGVKGQSYVVKQTDTDWTIYLHERPIEGAANKAIAELIAKDLGVAKSLVSIVKGEKSKQKVVEVIER